MSGPDGSPEIGHEPGDGPRVRSMIAAVAIVVALVILVFFTVGYLFGRAFL